MPVGPGEPCIACKILEKPDYWLLRYCRDKFLTVFGIFHTHVIFKKFCCNEKKFFYWSEKSFGEIWGKKISGNMKFSEY